MVRDVFDNNKANLETSLENLLIPFANQYLNELTLQDLINGIGGDGSDATDGPHLDDETGELICYANEEHPTSEYVPSEESSQSVDPTLPEESTITDEYKGNESTTLQVPDDVSNSSNFLFHKFQMIVCTIATVMSLRIL